MQDEPITEAVDTAGEQDRPAGVPPSGSKPPAPSVFAAAVRNLAAGFRFLFFRTVGLDDFMVTPDQVVVLCLVAVSASIFGEWFDSSGAVEFSSYGFLSDATYFLLLFIGLYMVARMLGQIAGFVTFAVIVLSIDAWTTLFSYGIGSVSNAVTEDDPTPFLWGQMAIWGWFIVLWVRASGLVFQGGNGRRLIAVGILVLAVILPVFSLPSNGYWVAAYDDSDYVPPINVEDTYYKQPALVSDAVDELESHRPGTVDLYHIGFGSDSGQQVFRREVLHVRGILDSRFDTEGRSLTLINSRETVEETPVASATNLRKALAGVADKMNTEEDVLLLYLTSHGSPKGRLSVKFWPMRLNNLKAEELRGMLDDAGIRWRVIVVSACFSGSFIDALKDDRTLVITAAAVDRTSFGCSNENEYTYFGEAYFKDALSQTHSFVDAFELAKVAVTKREKDEDLEPSNPAIYIGSEIEPKLDELETRLANPNAGSG